MLRNKCIVTSLMILMALWNFVEAASQSYAISFVAGPTGLGVVTVTQSGTKLQGAKPSISQMHKAMGSTAIYSYVSGWDGDLIFNIWVITGDEPGKPREVRSFAISNYWNEVWDSGTLLQIPGQYQPLHLFRTSRLLAAGTFGTSGANNYVSYSVGGRAKSRIFVNPDDRSLGTAAITPDGNLVSQMTFKGLNHIGVIGRLKNGELEGSPIKWLNVNDFQGYSQSLSNVIKPNTPTTRKRYLAYRNFRQPGTSKSESQVIIQNVDATTGKPQGSPRAITKLASAMNVESEKLQSIAISPDGKLILYTAWSDKCQKQILLARRLENGSSIGSPMIVCDCKQLEEYPVGVYGINIAQAPSLSN